MAKAGVPVLPGWSGDLETPIETLKAEARTIGYPILVKAAAGGGGKGMRLVSEEAELQAALEGAAREAKSAFGDSRVFLEKYIARSRHIEFQIFGDEHGQAVHLFERECSIQRRHQKIIEETPSVALTPVLRAQMGEAAVKAAKAIGYTNAGTVEFLFDDVTKGFYFLEVNTRLQVEHPVTEMTVHRDLVRLQIQVAQGEPLPFKQEDLSQDGHAFECRIYAEDPSQNFMPSIGTLHCYVPPEGPSIRVDSGVTQGSEVTIYYDPMLSKLITWGRNRTESLQKMHWALTHYPILGVTNNIEFLARIFEHPEFQTGNIHTHFLQEHPVHVDETFPDQAMLVAAWASTEGKKRAPVQGTGQTGETGYPSPWQDVSGWRAV
jgi:acetyl/propionyl-CoA carboxylase alpha subunit